MWRRCAGCVQAGCVRVFPPPPLRPPNPDARRRRVKTAQSEEQHRDWLPAQRRPLQSASYRELVTKGRDNRGEVGPVEKSGPLERLQIAVGGQGLPFCGSRILVGGERCK